jgi:hypothetical protein
MLLLVTLFWPRHSKTLYKSLEVVYFQRQLSTVPIFIFRNGNYLYSLRFPRAVSPFRRQQGNFLQ